MDSSKRPWLPYLAGLVAISVIVASLAAFAFHFEKQRYLERTQAAATNIVQLQAQNVSHLFDKVDVALQSGALFHHHQQITGQVQADELNEYLKNLESVVAEVDGIRILDEQGLVRYGHNIPTTQRANLSDLSFFLKARDDEGANGKLIVDGPLLARIAQKWVIVFARRLNKPDGSFAGVIYANLVTNQLERALSSVALGPYGAATIRTADLALVHRFPDTKNAVGSKVVSAELRDAIAARPEGGTYLAATALDGIERTNAYRKIEEHPFYIIVGLATQDYLGDSRQNLTIIIGLTLLTFLISAFASLQGYRSHQKTLSDLRALNELNKTLEQTVQERDQLNQDLAVKAREAQAASEAKNAFLANMSHELRTPLHQIHGYAHLLDRDPLSVRQKDRLKSLGHAVSRMTTLVESVLELTKMESGGLDLSEEPLDLQALVEGVLDTYRADAAEKHLALAAGAIPQTQGLVGDKLHVSQALAHYVANAVRFTQAGSIEVRATVEQEAGLNVLLRLEVQDTGIGIKPEDIPRLFSIFEQVDNSATRQFGGLGIGLAITRKIARALGGDAGCQSSYGHGSTFWLTVRLKQQVL